MFFIMRFQATNLKCCKFGCKVRWAYGVPRESPATAEEANCIWTHFGFLQPYSLRLKLV